MNPETAARWRSAGSILAVRLDALGDVVMTSPALSALHADGRRVTLLTSPSGAAPFEMMPYLHEVITYEAPWMKVAAPPAPNEVAALAELLAHKRFDAAVIFTVFSQNPLPAALLTYLAGIPLRAAYCFENPYHLLTDWLPDPDRKSTAVRHEAQRQIDLIESLGIQCRDQRLQLAVPSRAALRVESMLAEHGVTGSAPFVVVHPGATAASRRYPPERFGVVAGQLSYLGYKVFVTGSESEQPLIDALIAASAAPLVSLGGRLDLCELAALVQRAALLLTNNTGPAHIASALGTPLVDLYALTNPQHTPWMARSRVLNVDVPCRECFKSICPLGHNHCLTLVPASRVLDASLELLNHAPARSSQTEIIREAFNP